MDVIDNSGSPFDGLIIIGDNGLYVGSLSDKEQAEKVSQLASLAESDDGIAEIAPKLDYIPYQDINAVKCNLKTDRIYIGYDKRDGKKSEPSVRSINCQDQAKAREILAHLKLKRPDFNEQEKEYGPVRAGIKPSLFVLISAALTWMAMLLAKEVAAGHSAEISGSHRAAKELFLWLAETLGPNGTLVVGCFITLLFVRWLVKRVKNPPQVYLLYP
ncbi:hypothetical protein A11A3_15072 [Alcanivorax hongdengensis A-11-3]|uniref:Uncharacterized protein n=1 Tax=Alcanivorax hongdengensis A-11-3 TaxID=1177179 RepID=L0WBL9_9GAMM|nr:hypothetical protein [Alcanivorax hongdengensis]EKF73135.1 hypothetical protein A11A3_15072 [Alcanivorax hongdengensis A-11-3]